MGAPRVLERNMASVVFALPGSSLEVLWIRHGGLFIGKPREVGGAFTRMAHPTVDSIYHTEREAADAIAAFVGACKKDAA